MSNWPTEPEKKPILKAEDVAPVRQQIRQWLAKAHARAEANDKPLLVLVGEHHGSALSAMLSTIIYDESRALGVRDVALEKPANGDPLLKVDLQIPISRLKLMGHPLLYHLSTYHHDRQHMVDGRHMEATSRDLALTRRDETIAANLAHIRRPVLMLAGSQHLDGIERQMGLHGTHEVVSFDVSAVPLPSAQRIDHTIAHTHDASRLNDDTLLRMALGKDKGNQFIHWAESHGRKLSNAARDRHINSPISDSNRNPVALDQQLDALYDAGYFREATAMMARLNDACDERTRPTPLPTMLACITPVTASIYRRDDIGDSFFAPMRSVPVRRYIPVEPVAIAKPLPSHAEPFVKPEEKDWYSPLKETAASLMEDLSSHLPPFLQTKPRTSGQPQK